MILPNTFSRSLDLKVLYYSGDVDYGDVIMQQTQACLAELETGAAPAVTAIPDKGKET